MLGRDQEFTSLECGHRQLTLMLGGASHSLVKTLIPSLFPHRNRYRNRNPLPSPRYRIDSEFVVFLLAAQPSFDPDFDFDSDS